MSLKSTIHLLLQSSFAMVLAVMAGCSADPAIEGPETPPEGAVLCLSTGASTTRADGYDDYEEDPYSQGEDFINRVDLFFFSSNTEPDAAPFYICELTVQKNVSANLTVKVPIDKIGGFTDGKAYVYALVNLPAGQPENAVDVDAAKIGGKAVTLGGLKEVWVVEDGFTRPGVPSQFVMYGGSEIELQRDGGQVWAKGTISLERLASKIRLWVDIPEELYLDAYGKAHTRLENETDDEWEARKRGNEVWRSVPTTTQSGKKTSNVKLYITNLASRGRIDGATGSYEERDGEDILRYRSVTRNEADEASVRLLSEGVELKESASIDPRFAPYNYTHQTAYYSYPNVWESQRPSEQHQTYLILALPWERMEDRVFQNCYYQVPVNALRDGNDDAAADCLDPNRYYRIKLRIGMLGSKDLGDPLEVDASCEAVDWHTEDVDVSIKERRYLVVNQPVWTMNNISSLTVPFSSSHDVVAECYVTYFRYNDIWGNDSKNTRSDEPHNKTEFDRWVAVAADENIKESEGKISLDGVRDTLYWGETGQKLTQMLYYKKEYFYDQYYEELEGNGFRYYVGHEHPKTFQEDRIARPENLSGDAKTRWDEYQSIYGLDSVYTYRLDNRNQQITIEHPLVWWKEAYSDDDQYYYVPEMKNGRLRSEYSRCEITIKLRHIDRPANEHLFEQTIHITQYPGMYIEVSHDYGKPVPTSGSTKTGNQYVLVNANTTESDRYGDPFIVYRTNWNEVSSYMSYFGFVNNNPNMYVIHTTQLEEEDSGNYILGDPRCMHYNNQLGSNTRGENERLQDTADVPNTNGYWIWFGRYFERYTENIANALRLYDGTNGLLTYYYPADETDGAGSKESFVAPVFRVASSFGKVSLSYSWAEDSMGTNTLDIESGKEARRRCAVYQEAGRPAGRWREPTISEIEYVMQLSADNKIPHLFGLRNRNDEVYWCSTGIISIDLTRIDDPTDKRTSRERITRREWGYNMDTSPAVRCVYDEWYWNQVDGGEFPVNPRTGKRLTPTETTFYWGDRPKDNTQTPTQP